MASLWRVTWESTHDSLVKAANVTHYKARAHSVVSGDLTAAQVADAVASALTTKYRAAIGDVWTVNAVAVAEVLPPESTAVPEAGAHSIGLRGTISTTGDDLPIPCNTLCAFYTNAAVRSGHGRIFLPSAGAASILDTTGGYDTSATPWTAGIVPFCAELLVDIHATSGTTVDQDLSLVVYSRTRHARGDADYYFDVTSVVPRTKPHWLRSRMTAP